MQIFRQDRTRSLIVNLSLFSSFYFGLILTERQVIKKGLLDMQLPFQAGLWETLAGFMTGSAIIILLSAILNKNQHLLRILLVSLLLAGGTLINQHINRKIFYPPYTSYRYGDLEKLGDKQWTHDYAYSMYSAMYQKYYLRTVEVNSEIENIEELKRIERFGITIRESGDVPAELNALQFDSLEKIYGDSFLEISGNGYEVRLYDVGPKQNLLLTRYKDLILFVPGDQFGE